jgi:uncharacterized protein (DUF2342 family)
MTLGEGMPVRCHAMSGPSPDDPFGGIPFLGDLMKMLGAQGGGFRWDQAVQIAMQLATEGTPEDNPDPLERIALEQLARVAELQVGRVTGLETSSTGRPVSVVPVTRAMWIQRSAEVYRPLFEQLAASLAAGREGPAETLPEELADDPMAAMWGNVLDVMAPMMLSMTAGSMLGHLGRRSLGQYDLPVPRPGTDELLLVAPNVAEFGEA